MTHVPSNSERHDGTRGAPARGDVVLTHEAARAVYDRIGRWLDTQRFYEDHAIDELVRHAALGEARSVVELGTGTGRFAERLLRTQLPSKVTYRGLDVSTTMVRLTRARLSPWADRAVVEQTNGSPLIAAPAAQFDRFISTYVLDLLGADDIALVLTEAHRVLSADGLLCLVSATHGRTVAERAVMGAASRLHALAPALVGGCRAIDLRAHLPADRWRILHREVTSKWGIPSEILIAAPKGARMTTKPKAVLFACVQNAGRSQMAAAFFNVMADPARARAISAGSAPAAHVHPEVVEAMRDVGIDLTGATPQRLTDDLAITADVLVTMGCGEACPLVPGLRRIDWELADPHGASVGAVRAIRDDIRERVGRLIADEGWARDR